MSSHLMTSLLAWRNPHGYEEGWIGQPQRIDNTYKHIGKVVATEAGLCLLAITSLIETVAYTALGLVSLTLYPMTNKPYTFFAKLLQSSSFTIIWGIADAIIYNPFVVNVMTRESFARYWAEYCNPTPLSLFRLEDSLYVAEWQGVNQAQDVGDGMLGPIVNAGQATQEMIDLGAQFIRDEILAGVSDQTLQQFKQLESGIYMFVLTKAVFIYAAGSKCKENIPSFFKPNTRNFIATFRSEILDQDVLIGLRELTQDYDKFKGDPSNKDIKSAFDRLRTIAAEELQGGLFVTACCEQAATSFCNQA